MIKILLVDSMTKHGYSESIGIALSFNPYNRIVDIELSFFRNWVSVDYD